MVADNCSQDIVCSVCGRFVLLRLGYVQLSATHVIGHSVVDARLCHAPCYPLRYFMVAWGSITSVTLSAGLVNHHDQSKQMYGSVCTGS